MSKLDEEHHAEEHVKIARHPHQLETEHELLALSKAPCRIVLGDADQFFPHTLC